MDEYQIIPAGSSDPAASADHPRIRIGDAVYPSSVVGGCLLSEFDARQQGLVRRGQYGATVAAYVAACEELGVSPRLNWSGVINALGDHARVTPPKAVLAPAAR